MSAFSSSFIALLLSVPLATLAQATDPAPTHPFYAGLAVYSGANQSIDGFYGSTRFNVPVQATFGYQLRPRLALEVGLVYSGAKREYTDSYEYTGSNAALVTHSTVENYSRRSASASLLARYTLTRQASHRFQVDVAGGLSFGHAFYQYTGTDTYASQGVIDVLTYDRSYNYNSLRADLGPSFRYRFGERLEAVGDILFNIALTNDLYNPNTSVALGLRYRFGEPR